MARTFGLYLAIPLGILVPRGAFADPPRASTPPVASTTTPPGAWVEAQPAQPSAQTAAQPPAPQPAAAQAPAAVQPAATPTSMTPSAPQASAPAGEPWVESADPRW